MHSVPSSPPVYSCILSPFPLLSTHTFCPLFTSCLIIYVPFSPACLLMHSVPYSPPVCSSTLSLFPPPASSLTPPAYTCFLSSLPLLSTLTLCPLSDHAFCPLFFRLSTHAFFPLFPCCMLMHSVPFSPPIYYCILITQLRKNCKKSIFI